MLSTDEKISIINQHLRNIEYLLYNSELDLIQANAVTEKDEALIDSINEKMLNLNAKKDVLLQEIEKIS